MTKRKATEANEAECIRTNGRNEEPDFLKYVLNKKLNLVITYTGSDLVCNVHSKHFVLAEKATTDVSGSWCLRWTMQ